MSFMQKFLDTLKMESTKDIEEGVKENNMNFSYNDIKDYDLKPFDLKKHLISDGYFTAIELEGDNLKKAYYYLQEVHKILLPYKYLYDGVIFPEKIGIDYRINHRLPTSHLRLVPYTPDMRESKYPFYLWLSYFGNYGTEYIYTIYFDQSGEIGKCDLSLHGSNEARISYETKIRRSHDRLYVMRINKTLYIEPYGTQTIYQYEDIKTAKPQIITLERSTDFEASKSIIKPVEEVEKIQEMSDVKIQEIVQEDAQENRQKNLQIEPYKYVFPPISLLDSADDSEKSKEEIREQAKQLNQILLAFNIKADIVDISHGARFTRFEIQIGQSVRVKDILKIEDDIKLNLATPNLHIEAPIPGKTTIGIDVENKNTSLVTFREMVESKEFKEFSSDLAIAIGKDISGNTIVESIENMCHLLIAGTTGSGKSVCINSIIMSILYKADPNKIKMILIDTKAVNLCMYNGIPYLMLPVVTDLQRATEILNWAVLEMTDRYRKFADVGARELASYNSFVENQSLNASLQKMSNIILIIDDFSDLIVEYTSQMEENICRLAQMGRTCGIHLIISTQRPSVDVITGIIKANFPSRIAFNVFSAIDSRTILDAKGAEKLLGDGDMLFYPKGKRKPLRVQGAFVSDKEVSEVVEFIKGQCIDNNYTAEVEEKIANLTTSGNGSGFTNDASERDSYFVDAGKFIIEKEKASIGMLQRAFKIRFNRAARIMDQLEEVGVVGPEEGTKPRRVLMSQEQFEQLLEENI